MKYLLLTAIIAFAPAGDGQTKRQTIAGSPFVDATSRELELFRLGLESFNASETADEGLGPAFNGTSCAQCHSIPAIGGIAHMSEVRAGKIDSDGKFTAIHGETLYPLFSTGKHTCQVQIPAEANLIARRVPIPLFGSGLVEAISDATLLALESRVDDGDGVGGRAAHIVDPATKQPRIGRFGWKSQHATLLAFSGDAYRNEMGVTNDLFREELAPGVSSEQMKLCNPSPGIEDVRSRLTGLRDIDNFENFMRLLAPIERALQTEDSARGESLFNSIGCASCHVPQLMTGPNPNPLFDRKPVNLYSDLLLHDIGTVDGIEQDGAGANEIRTPALWGLRMRRPLLHDGSAATAADAIRLHHGQAQKAQQRFMDLSATERKWLIAFLDSL